MTNHDKVKPEIVVEQPWLVAAAKRDSRYSAVLTAYQEARIDGLCQQGAWECALETMRALGLDPMSIFADDDGLPD